MNAVITIGIDPNIHLGPITLAWHGVTIALGILIGGGVAAAGWLRHRGYTAMRKRYPLRLRWRQTLKLSVGARVGDGAALPVLFAARDVDLVGRTMGMEP